MRHRRVTTTAVTATPDDGQTPPLISEGFREVGCVDRTVGICESLMESKSRFHCADAESICAMTWRQVYLVKRVDLYGDVAGHA